MAASVRSEQAGVNDERYSSAQSIGRTTAAGRCSAAYCGRRNGTAEDSSCQRRRCDGRSGSCGNGVFRCADQSSGTAEGAVCVAGRRRVEAGITGISNGGGGAGARAESGVGTGTVFYDAGGDGE